jgi:ribonucleoside-triphosphate reductase
MKCPKCNSKNLKVIDKRESGDTSRKGRECIDCGAKFTTYETIETESDVIVQIRKRDGNIVLFDQERITNAIFKAAKAVGDSDRKKAEELSDQVVKLLNEKFKGQIPSIEDIQDLVEKILIENRHAQVAKAYILYRDAHKKIRDKKEVVLEIGKTMNEYLDKGDWRVNENANSGFSVGGLIMYIAGKMTANYWLNHIYPKEVKYAHFNGDIHLHDISMLTCYCAGWSMYQILVEGFGGVPGQLKTVPAKHFDTVIGQIVNFLGTLQNEWAGAQALSSVDTYMAPFVRADNLDYKKVKQKMQNLLFHLATPSRWATQTPFINFTFDWVVPEDMKNKKAIVGGKEQDFTYGECQKEMDMINKAFIECMTEGDASGRVFTFPIPTYNITRDFNWDSENANLLFEMTAKYGIPYFQNFINSDLRPDDVRCRLRLNLRDLRKKTGGLFGNGENTGSIGVVTINLPRIGYLSKTKEEFFERLGRLMDIGKLSLEIKRKFMSRQMEIGLLPYTKRYLGNLNHHFSTIGLNGMNETCLNFLNKDIGTKEGKKFAEEVLDFMRERLIDYQEKTGNIYNLEATPAEGTSYRFAKIDKEKYPNIITAGSDELYYTNSTLLPVGFTDDLFEVLEHQDSLQTRYTGGTVVHCFLGERINDVETCKQLVKKIAYNYRLPYYTISPTFSVCADHGYLNGEVEKCPKCGKATEVYSRVVGYLRPVSYWNKGKKEEFKERKVYSPKHFNKEIKPHLLVKPLAAD